MDNNQRKARARRLLIPELKRRLLEEAVRLPEGGGAEVPHDCIVRWSPEVVNQHVRLLVEAGHLNAANFASGHGDRWRIYPLPWAGHQELERLSTDVHEPQKHPGGRPPTYDWDTFWIAMCDYVLNEGLPPKRSALVEHMATWCTRAWGEGGEPSEPQLKVHVKRFYAAYDKFLVTVDKGDEDGN